MPSPLFPTLPVPSGTLWLSLAGGTCAALLFLVTARWLVDWTGTRTVRRQSKATTVHGRERRTCVRRKGCLVTVLIAEGTDKRHTGWIVDRSLGGLRLSVQKPMPLGTALHTRPVEAPRPMPWVELMVRSCQARDGRWEIGCQFVRTPPWSQMLHFG